MFNLYLMGHRVHRLLSYGPSDAAPGCTTCVYEDGSVHIHGPGAIFEICAVPEVIEADYEEAQEDREAVEQDGEPLPALEVNGHLFPPGAVGCRREGCYANRREAETYPCPYNDIPW